MSRQIVKQPDGKYSVWSTEVDDFVRINATPEEIIDEFVEKEKRAIEKSVGEIVAALEKGEKPYYQLTKTYQECLERIEEIKEVNLEWS